MIPLRVAGWAGLLGVSIVFMGALLTALHYQGYRGESYSVFNHFVSELGQVKVSSWATVYNSSLMAGNGCLAVFSLGVATHLRGFLGWGFGLFALVAAVSGGLIGIFPMDYLRPHLLVALIFFYSSLAATSLFLIRVLFFTSAPPIRSLALPTLICVGSFASFVFEAASLRNHLREIVKMLSSQRPVFWLLPSLEWLAFIALLAWIAVVSGYLIKESRMPQKS